MYNHWKDINEYYHPFVITGDGVYATFVFADVSFTTEAVQNVPLLLMRDISTLIHIERTDKFTDKQQSAGRCAAGDGISDTTSKNKQCSRTSQNVQNLLSISHIAI